MQYDGECEKYRARIVASFARKKQGKAISPILFFYRNIRGKWSRQCSVIPSVFERLTNVRRALFITKTQNTFNVFYLVRITLFNWWSAGCSSSVLYTRSPTLEGLLPIRTDFRRYGRFWNLPKKLTRSWNGRGSLLLREDVTDWSADLRFVPNIS